jgi:hypothetical protein
MDDLHISYVTKGFVLENAAVQMQQKERLKHILGASVT